MSTIAILGAGNVGQALGRRLLSHGGKVRFGVREPKKAKAALAAAKLSIPVMSRPRPQLKPRSFSWQYRRRPQ